MAGLQCILCNDRILILSYTSQFWFKKIEDVLLQLLDVINVIRFSAFPWFCSPSWAKSHPTCPWGFGTWFPPVGTLVCCAALQAQWAEATDPYPWPSERSDGWRVPLTARQTTRNERKPMTIKILSFMRHLSDLSCCWADTWGTHWGWDSKSPWPYLILNPQLLWFCGWAPMLPWIQSGQPTGNHQLWGQFEYL